MTTNRPDDVRQHFDAELDTLRLDSVALGALVLENCRRLAEALIENDLELAALVVEADNEIDEFYVALERRTFLTMALQQPVARDLRLLVSLTRLLYEIERSGDLVVNGAKGLLRQEGYEMSPSLRSILGRLGHMAADVFSQGLDTLRDLDKDAGVRLDAADDAVDDLVSEFYTRLAAEQERSDMHLDPAVELSRVGRYLERIADHGVNVADHVTFIVTGSFPDHQSPAVAHEDER
ncbi:phosphate signaling complex protein PhoU [bacterium]|nr:phosphate signaling complex protein PhoU [bacterium]